LHPPSRGRTPARSEAVFFAAECRHIHAQVDVPGPDVRNPERRTAASLLANGDCVRSG
jgi:hypothetical protein